MEKITIRIPAEARETVLQTADLVRESPSFLNQLKRMIEEHQRPSIAIMLEQVLQRLDTFEKRLDGIDAELQESGGQEFSGPNPDWISGSGAGKKLTILGEEELIRLFERGLSDKQISRRIGINISSVSVRRKRYDLERSARSGQH